MPCFCGNKNISGAYFGSNPFPCNTMSRLKALGTTSINSSVHVCLTASLELWLLNKTDADIQLNPGELFGFGPVKASEVALGLGF